MAKKFNEFNYRDMRGKLEHEKFAKFLIKEHNLISIEDTLHEFNGCVYVPINNKRVNRLLGQYISNTKASEGAEVVRSVDMFCPMYPSAVEDNETLNLIPLKNGVYDIVNKKLLPFNPKYRICLQIPTAYDENAYQPDVDKLMTNICRTNGQENPEKRMLLQEMMGLCLLRKVPCPTAFILIGKALNGKSCFESLLSMMLGGSTNVSTVSLVDICDNKFERARVFGKLANIGDDISGNHITDNAYFKSLVSGETVGYERKCENGHDAASFATMIFSANRLPSMPFDGGVERRVSIIPFTTRFTPSSPFYDFYIKDRILADKDRSMSYLLKLAIDGLNRLMADNWKLIHLEESDELVNEYASACDPIRGWIEEFEEEYYTLEGQEVAFAFRKYCEYCDECRLKTVSRNTFTSKIRDLKDLKSSTKRIGQKVVRVFVSCEETNN